MKRIVVSGVNIDSAGPLAIFRDCLEATEPLLGTYAVTALVHDRSLFEGLPDGIEFIEFPLSKRRWVFRLWFEYVVFHRLSRKIDPYLWFSIHDTTPRVQAQRRAVYCHNPEPFHRFRWVNLWYAPKQVAFKLWYAHLYRINIHANDAVVVQQDWIRNEFTRLFGLDRVVVAHPQVAEVLSGPDTTSETEFCYPCMPRVFKNVELACEAFARLGDTGATLRLTIDGTENRYARMLHRKFARHPQVRFEGAKTRDEVFEMYRRARALVFPSRLETWGLPLTEFRQTGKPIFVANCPYARETLSGYANACFVDHEDARELEGQIRSLLYTGEFRRSRHEVHPEPPFTEGWNELWSLLLEPQNEGAPA